MFTEPYLNTRRVGRILESYANPQLRLGFAQLSRILPTLHLFRWDSVNTEKVLYCLKAKWEIMHFLGLVFYCQSVLTQIADVSQSGNPVCCSVIPYTMHTKLLTCGDLIIATISRVAAYGKNWRTNSGYCLQIFVKNLNNDNDGYTHIHTHRDKKR